MNRSMLALVLTVACASTACMSAAHRYRPEGAPPSHALIGGIVGDGAMAAVAGAIIGYADDDQTAHDVRFFWPIFGSLLLADAALLTVLYLTRK